MAKVDLLALGVFIIAFMLGFVHSEINIKESANIATGGSYTFKPPIKEKFQTFDWRHNGNLVVSWDPVNNDPNPRWYRYQDRAKLDTVTGELTLSQLKKEEDNSVIKGQFEVNRVLQYIETTVTVIDPISKVNLICEKNGPNVTLLCSADPPAWVKFSWKGPNGFTSDGESVSVSPSNQDIYFCTAKNEVSTKGKEISIKDCAKDNKLANNGGADNVAAIVVPILALSLLFS